MALLATITRTGRASIAKAIAARPIHLGWGTGEEAWDDLEENALPPLDDREALFAEVGRRLVSTKAFVLPDDAGDITVPTGLMPDGSVQTARYQLSEKPTPYLYFRVNYDFGDAATAVIRELGIFMDTETNADLPPGQMYFTPDQLVNAGDLLAIQIVRPSILRSPSIRQILEFVLPV